MDKKKSSKSSLRRKRDFRLTQSTSKETSTWTRYITYLLKINPSPGSFINRSLFPSFFFPYLDSVPYNHSSMETPVYFESGRPKDPLTSQGISTSTSFDSVNNSWRPSTPSLVIKASRKPETSGWTRRGYRSDRRFQRMSSLDTPSPIPRTKDSSKPVS